MQVETSDPIVIIGAGPAGLAAATALIERGVLPIVLEADLQVGGISKTLVHGGNRMDIGGHRFFSKNPKVMEWWLARLPLQGGPASDDIALGRRVPVSDAERAPDPETQDAVMLSRSRLSRIYFLRRLFDYPISLSASTLRNLGLARIARIGASYVRSSVRPIRPEATLEDFMINRFGRELYLLFFKDYTEKVWGVPCTEIGPAWGAQRIKGISISAALRHALVSAFRRDESVSQTDVETSLIGRFLYPKYGPGQLWESVADEVRRAGCDLRLGTEVTGIRFDGGRVVSVSVRDVGTGQGEEIACSSVLSSMPVRDLLSGVSGADVPPAVRDVAAGLPYRDFVTCGLLMSRLKLANPEGSPILDNWIYIQEPEVRLGRLQVFNNWSPYLVSDPAHVWLGLEYFCDEGDEMWETPDDRFADMAASELARIGVIDDKDVLDHVVYRVRKAYPAYFGTYERFGVVRDWLDSVPNLFVMGRNGTHRYNNMDHSMLSAWAAVEAAVGTGSRGDIWSVNADEDYHEAGSDET